MYERHDKICHCALAARGTGACLDGDVIRCRICVVPHRVGRLGGKERVDARLMVWPLPQLEDKGAAGRHVVLRILGQLPMKIEECGEVGNTG